MRLAMAGLAIPYARRPARADSPDSRPNVILVMSDDQGWGDTGYNGHPILQTPNLDKMASEGIRFERFYSGAPVCSPTRGSCLTGRHPFRLGIFGANAANGFYGESKYVLPSQESTLAEVLKSHGYATGHFGKWHLGDLQDSDKQCTPGQNGFDEWFSTVRKVATLDPVGYVHNGRCIDEPLRGDDSEIIMDRAEPFIRNAVEGKKPFFTVIWFHTPHLPVLATPEDRERYAEHSERKQNYWGALTAMDRQIGRLRALLEELQAGENTMLWFCSDNGPTQAQNGPGSPGGLRGWKGTLFEGGVRVPGLLVWPNQIQEAKTINMPCSTGDYYPTILDCMGIQIENQPRLDGISLRPALEGVMQERPAPIAFEHRDGATLIGNRYKLICAIEENSLTSPALYDLIEDPSEKEDIAGKHLKIVKDMTAHLTNWRTSCTQSREGADYAQP